LLIVQINHQGLAGNRRAYTHFTALKNLGLSVTEESNH